ncbi:MAG TPA: hypothetical protein VK043_05420 [Burkholderiales bacterium]|nr:hypothetical protein [Burkholderiales bacterium]
MDGKALVGPFRIVGWVVIAAMAIALLYAVSIALKYYQGIGV